MMSTLKKEGAVVIPNAKLALTFFTRFMGLMGKSNIADDEAVVFPKCNSIHTFFMRFPIDVVMVEEGGKVVDVIEAYGAWKMMLPRWKAKHTIEMRAGRAKDLGIKTGDVLVCEGAW